MARFNEIASTEKLLDIIRKKTDVRIKENHETASEIPPVLPLPKRSAELITLRKISSYKSITLGVDIGHEQLRLVKAARDANGQFVIPEHKSVPIPPSLGRESAEFADFLKSELNSFGDAKKKQQIWAIMSAANVEVHHIRIPKVPKKQIESVVYWTVRKETPFDEKDNIFDFEVMGEVTEQGITKFAVMYYTAPKKVIEETKRLFSRSGWPLTGLSVTPFAVQNIFRTLRDAGGEGTAASLFIGNDFSRIDIYGQGKLIMTRGIKTGMSSMLESLIEDINGKAAGRRSAPAQIDRHKAREILSSLNPDAPPLPEEKRYGLQKEDIWEMILPAMERLVRQVERTFEYFTVNLGNDRVDKIFVSSSMNVCQPISEYLGRYLGIQSEIFDPLGQQLSSRQGGQVYSLPESIAFAPALGIALSDNVYTPNLIYTYKDKEEEANVKRINFVTFAAFLLSVTLCAGFFSYQLHAISQKRKTLLDMSRQLSQFQPLADRERVLKTLAATRKAQTSVKMYARRHLGLAIISELSAVTGPDIRITDLKAKLGGQPEMSKEATQQKPETAQARPKAETKEVEIEGFVSGEKDKFDATLANYMMKLDKSPLLQQIKIQKTNEESFRKSTLLRFHITMKVEGF